MWTNIPEHNLFCFYYVLCFIVHHYSITISKQNSKINTITIGTRDGGGGTELLIGGLMITLLLSAIRIPELTNVLISSH